ncbi:hypothetical protein [Capillimicrobium parvum]|uniref:Uncharacterized protein n=1 Tax=Capillimicrobium parvum TaxID=2884022 RepID=A0A9E6Y2D2_9ACTN|nr:hypothetical protein [Capillimicrobium parvum]UGS38749.1 hypothetical protein DSM104329_05179 [Capillimicrobium parvum]
MMFTGAGGPMVGRRVLRARRVVGRVAAVVAAALAIIAIDAGAANASLALLKPSPTDLATFSGHGGFSTDGLGQFEPGGTIQAEVPAGATVVQAYLYGTYSGTTAFDPATNATIDFDGTNVVLAGLPDVSPGCCSLNAARATVTAQVAAKVGTAGGITDFVIGNDPPGLEGVGLLVIYSAPSLPEVTIAALDGGAAQAGDTVTFLFANPLDTTAPGFASTMAIGSGFSFQGGQPGHICGGGQFSTIDINAQRLTSCAGNFDDGAAGNGALITVGGVGDSIDNPVDPNSSTTGEDDELYNLVPLLHQGDTQLKIDTANPSDDDNVFLAVIQITARARATTVNCDDPANANNPECQAPPPSAPPPPPATPSSTTTTTTTTAAPAPPAPVAESPAPPVTTTTTTTVPSRTPTRIAVLSARLSGAPSRGCVSSSTIAVKASVSGRRSGIRVRVRLDGKVIASSTKRSFTVKVPVASLDAGRHRLVVRATGRNARSSTRSYVLRKCSAVSPTFTG